MTTTSDLATDTPPILYHNGSAVCAAKVRLVLAEKGVGYEGREIDLTRCEQFAPDYLRLNPQGVVPTLVHRGRVLVESTVIAEYIDAAFEGSALRPPDPFGRAQCQLWTRREDGVHAIINTLTTVAVFRPELLGLPAADRAARIARLPDPARQAKLRALLDQGVGSPIVAEAMARLARHVADMQQALAHGPWLLGERFSLADAGLASFFYRLELLGLAALWAGAAPAVERWFAAIQSRAGFAAAIAGYIADDVREHYRRYGRAVAPELLKLSADR